MSLHVVSMWSPTLHEGMYKNVHRSMRVKHFILGNYSGEPFGALIETFENHPSHRRVSHQKRWASTWMYVFSFEFIFSKNIFFITAIKKIFSLNELSCIEVRSKCCPGWPRDNSPWIFPSSAVLAPYEHNFAMNISSYFPVRTVIEVDEDEKYRCEVKCG